MKKSEQTCHKILGCAEVLFSERGVAGTSLRAIAESAGIQAGTILHHFPGGKDQLFNELVAAIFDQLIAQLAVLEQGERDIRTSITLLASEIWDYFENNPKKARIVLREAMEVNSQAFASGRYQARLIAKAAKVFMQEGVESGHIQPVDAESFMHTVLSHILVFHAAPALTEMIYEESTTATDKTRFLAHIQLMLVIPENEPAMK